MLGRSLSIIIPSLNEGDSVEQTVHNIVNTIKMKSYEIIVVNSGGTETSNIRGFPVVNVFDTPREGAPQARNFGAQRATGDFLLFADAHLEFKDGWGARMLYFLEHKKDSILTPCISAFGDENSRGCGFRWESLTMDVFWLPDVVRDVHEIPFACACCMAIERKLFYQIGQFDEGTLFWGEEDSEISLRAWLLGHRVLSVSYTHLTLPTICSV